MRKLNVEVVPLPLSLNEYRTRTISTEIARSVALSGSTAPVRSTESVMVIALGDEVGGTAKLWFAAAEKVRFGVLPEPIR